MQGRLQIEVVKIAMAFLKSSNEMLPFVVLCYHLITICMH